MTARARCVLALFLFLACDQTVQPEPPKPSAVAVTLSATTLLGVGETMQLTAEVQDQYGKPMPSASVRWTSDTPATATVDDQGVVTAVANGAATITAAVGDVQAMSAFAIGNPDRAALVALYGAADGPNWKNNENWLTDAPLGEWYGVDTDASGRVVKLELNSQLFGTVPAALGYLAALEHLDLGNSVWTGPIPAQLGNLTALKFLDLSGSLEAVEIGWGLTDTIPAELGNLAALEHLDLGNNLLVGPIPPELGNLTSLTRLDLRVNYLSGPIPLELADLTSLETLHLDGNGLSGPIPAELDGLTSLTLLSLGYNGLSDSIPAELGDLTSLDTLDLAWNSFSGPIPAELGNLTNLAYLHLAGNDLSDPIPPELGNLTSLGQLFLGNNDLSDSIPAELGDLTALTTLDLADNDLSGPVPTELADLAALTWLDLGGNALSDTIPAELGDLAALTTLDLADNDLTGPIPAELGNLAALKVLDLGDNSLSDSIPVELGNLAALTTLNLADNELTGPVPRELGNLAALTTLDVRDNPLLQGALPLSLTRVSLEALLFSGTGLCTYSYAGVTVWLNSIVRVEGPLGTCELLSDREILRILYETTDGSNWGSNRNWLTDAPLEDWFGVDATAQGRRVVRLRLSGQNMTGPIPPEMGYFTALEELELRGNKLTGTIPPSLGNLRTLKLLDLTRNQLTGPIPEELSGVGVSTPTRRRLIALERLLLSDNALTGPIPGTLGALPRLEALTLARNNLTDSIPGSLGRLRQLEALGLHDNALTGPIPPELGGLTELNSLNLSNNALTGPIPAELGELRALGRLDLNDNALTGPIPAELGDLPALDWMLLNNNALSGPIPTELGDLTGLRRLELADNALTGSIPAELGDLDSLQVLDLRNNTLTGPIPSELGDLAALGYAGLGHNALTGPIPAELGNLDLIALELNHNALTGAIPPELGNLAKLEGLVLNYNALTGAIPAELGDLTALEWLELSHNALTGPIPSELGSLAALEWLNVSWNEGLSGTLPVTLTRLGNLFSFLASNTELCAGAGPAFQRWAEALDRYWVRQCSAGAAYLVQAAQSLDHPVPLVAGRDAVLRVFPTAPAGTTVPVPLVRASFYDSDSDTAAYQVDIAGKPGPLPVEIDESNTLISANVRIPDSILSPGLEMVVEIDPDGALDSTLAITRRIPETGSLPLDVRQMPALNLTVVPFLWTADPDSVILDQTAAMATDPDGHELLLETRTLLPVGELAVTTRPPVLTSSNDALTLVRETAAIWALEGGSGHWIGMMSGPLTGTSDPAAEAAGVASVPYRVSFSKPQGSSIAHQLGHTMSLFHAPCGGAGMPDPAYPSHDGSTGAWGYNLQADTLVGPNTPDLMSHCSPAWVSAYHFGNALRFRLSDEGDDIVTTVAEPEASVLLWGGVDTDGTPYLEPAFAVDAPPLLSASAGPHQLTGLSASGQTLFSISFEMPAMADGGGESSFVFVVPGRDGWEGDLASITLSGPGGSATLDGDTNQPMTILLDPGSGRVRGLLRGRSAGGQTAADNAWQGGGSRTHILFSRGMPDATARNR